MATKKSAKKSAKSAPKAKSEKRPAHWPATVEGCPVIGETAGGSAWVIQGENGPRHVLKA